MIKEDTHTHKYIYMYQSDTSQKKGLVGGRYRRLGKRNKSQERNAEEANCTRWTICILIQYTRKVGYDIDLPKHNMRKGSHPLHGNHKRSISMWSKKIECTKASCLQQQVPQISNFVCKTFKIHHNKQKSLSLSSSTNLSFDLSLSL